MVANQWKLLTNRDGSYAELYDLSAGPYEAMDVSQKHSEVVQQMQQQLKQWQSSLPSEPTGDVFSKERSTETR